jgi:succinate dehydrogenase/fumarate reductase-like Fe-S protein
VSQLNLKRLMAIGNLGIRTFGWYAKLPFRIRPDLDRFLENYRADRLTPMRPEERERLPVLAACIACGLCDAYCPALERAGRLGLPGLGAAHGGAAAAGVAPAPARTYRRSEVVGPMELACGQSRGIPDYDALAPALEALGSGCASCAAPCTQICPTGVPLPELLAFVRSHLERQQ